MSAPNGWQVKPLSALAQYINGYAFKPDDWGKDGLPIIRIEQLKDPNTITDYFSGRLPEANIIEDGDLVFSWSASLFLRIWNHGRAALNQHLFKVVEAESVNRLFLKLLIEYYLPELTKASHGSTMQHITRKELDRFTTLLPSDAHEQSRIAEVLSTVDRAIAQTEALIAKQQRIKTGLMQDLLTRGIDEHGQLRSEATHAFKDSPLGRIPVEWEVTTLEQIAAVSGGKRLPAGHSYAEGKTGYVYLRVLDFFNRDIDVDSLVSLEGDTFQSLQRYEIRDGELCISIAGSLGYVSVLRLPNNMRAILTENALRIVPGSEVDSDYLCMAMNGLAVQSQVEALKGTGGGVPKLALHRVKSLLVAFPKDKAEQERMVNRTIALTNTVLEASKQVRKLQHLKTALMQDLLTGKVRVTPLLQPSKEAIA